VAKRIGELLVDGGLLSQLQLEQALFAQRKDGRKLGQLLVELGLVSEVQLIQTLSRQLSVPWVSLYHVDFSRSLLNLVPREAAERYCLVPIFVRRVRKQGETLYVAMDDPTNEAAIQEVTRASTLPVKPMIACPSDIRAAIRVYYFGEAPAPAPAPRLSAPGFPPGLVPAAGPAAPAPSPASLKAPPGASPAPVATPARRSAPSLPPASAPGSGPVSAPAPMSSPGHAPVAAAPPSVRSPADDGPAVDGKASQGSVSALPRMRPKMISLTLLDGTHISLPAPPKRTTMPPDAGPRGALSPAPAEELSDQLTARDLISALRAVAHGVDASEILGTEPRWEAMFAALLSIMLRKGLIADWEFIEEFRKV
jgi:type IV pilus assembly protein PilB